MIIRNKFNGYAGDGIRLYPGGGGQAAPTSQNVTQTTIPEYAQPYVERMLGKAEAFSETPYQAYGGQRIADFSPLQQQAFQGAANLGPAQQIGQGSQLAGMAGLGSLGAGQRYAQQATNPYAQQAYMSPYIQNALEPQMAEARRQSEMMGQQNAAQAVQAGAFGGSRFGIQEAERQRNLGQNLANIYGTGMQNAFQQAQQAQQFGATLGLQGMGQAGQAAATLGQLGQQQFGQQQGAMQAQAAAGAQQQAMEQQKLTQQYQDFLTQRGYPQQQLAFMSDILRGIPLGQQTQTQYTAPASIASQAAQLGLGAYGLFGGKNPVFGAEGGQVKGYAEGGIASANQTPTTVPIDKIRSMLGDMNDEQLAQVAQSTNDAVTLALVNEQQKLNQRIRNSQILAKSIPQDTIKDELLAGIDSAPLPENMFGDTAVGEQPELEEPAPMAGGGIVAFAKGDKVEAKPAPAPNYSQQLAALDPNSAIMTEDERDAATQAGIARVEKYMGKDEVAPMVQELIKSYQETYGPEAREQQKQMLALKAASKFGRRGKTFTEELGEAMSGAAADVAEFKKAEQEAKKQAAMAQIELAKAQRAEKRGNFDLADKYATQAATYKQNAMQLRASQLEKLAGLEVQREQIASHERTAREQTAAMRAAHYNFDQSNVDAQMQQGIEDYRAKYGTDPTGKALADIRVAAFNKAAEARRLSPFADVNAETRRAQALTQFLDKDEQLNKLGEAYGMALMGKDTAKQAALKQQIDARKQALTAEFNRMAAQQLTPTAAAPEAQSMPNALPLPADKAQLQAGQVYNTARGPARWDGTKFNPI